MTEETKFQKGAIFVGLKRSGKSTISRVLQQLVGDRSYVSVSFSTWVSNENSAQCLIGKRVVVFPDVRFKPARHYGASYDPGGIDHKSAELLLNVTGEDPVTIGRKYLGSWHGQLRLKPILISNEVPNLNDSQCVLPSRFVKFRFGESFFGREDVGLLKKLEGELGGIAARCLRAYRRLCERGHFIQPKSADALELAVREASDPFTAMMQDCFKPDPEGWVTKGLAYDRFTKWCREKSRMDLWRSVPNNKFGAKLREVPGFERVSDFRPSGQPRGWAGVKFQDGEG